MRLKRNLSLVLLALFTVCVFSATTVRARSSGTSQPEADETNLDTQLYLIVATDKEVDEAKMPAALDPVVRQLRGTLPFKNYRLAATLINRVKNDGRLDLNWIGGPLASPSGASSNLTPSFSQFKIRQVRLVKNSEGQSMVQMAGFTYGARIPIQTSGAIAANGAVAPAFNYETTGLATDISLREGEPVVVGTLNIGPSGDAVILVVSAKRTPK
jgi:hypothetical protein